ncbi:hypothetical protein C8D76_103122 [Pasteurella langaaensis DSM 22999]|uniref:Holin family HP1 protein n=1 Tax=Alitibacter langaaensis DSM 22999 TaxID=1122935 RepID=A0A2U0TAD6_9PAST|nr:hypothetical protein [Pasteurella langaaensis]PVX40549.1 hypothetical protein C8D76_103122 [Pasteurella langaaensis DSM 22999]
MKMLKDMGTQSYIWSGFGGFIAWLGDQQNLMMLSLAVGILTALVNMYQKCREGRIKKREEERAEELHQLKVARLRKGLDDDWIKKT